jgi:hypothetical protein
MDEQNPTSQYTDRQLRVIAEIQRVARELGVDRLSRREFDRRHQLAGESTADYQFGTWNEAVRAAGLEPYEPGQSNVGPKLTDEALLHEIVRLHLQLGKRPSEYDMARHGHFSPKPFRDRWGSRVAARDAAYERFGLPEGGPAEPGAAADGGA